MFYYKNQLHTEEESNAGNKEQKRCKTNSKEIALLQKSLLIGYFSCKWIKSSNQKTETGQTDSKNEIQLRAVYKRVTSDPKTYIG